VTTYRPFRKKKPYSLAIFIIIAAIFFSVSAFNGLFGIRYFINGVIFPFQYMASSAISGVLSIPASVIGLKNLAIENTDLKNKLNAANAKLIILDELALENKRLQNDLNFQNSLPFGYRTIPAKIIARGSAPYINLVEINRGAGAGIKKDMPVIVPEGLVGRVIEVFPLSSRVMLACDPMHSIAAVDQRSRDFGVVEGYTPNLLTMRYVNARGNVKEGDMIVTSSISNTFPAGIPIGAVKTARKNEGDLFYEIKLVPAVSFSRLEEVFVIN